MNIFFLLFTAFFSAGMMCLFLAYFAVPAIIIGCIWIIYKNWKNQFFPNGVRSKTMPPVNPDYIHGKSVNDIIDVDFHEIK